MGTVETSVSRAFVAMMLAVMKRGLVAVSRTDDVVRAELAPVPEGFVFELKVLPSGPGLRVRKEAGALVDDDGDARPSVSVQIKHLKHAVRALAFVESVPSALANGRIVVDGDPAWAMRMQRVADRMQALMLPRVVAERALKRVPAMPAGEKARAAARLYARMAMGGGKR